MKLLAILISLLMMPCKIEKTEMLPILVRAEGCAEKADALYKQMYNFIWEEYERGKSDIAEEGWDGIVRPLEEQAYSYKDVKQKAETKGKEAFFHRQNQKYHIAWLETSFNASHTNSTYFMSISLRALSL